ncbi:hypothetical protein [Nocardioides marmoraquaticus]
MRALENAAADLMSIESVDARREDVRGQVNELGELPECLAGCGFLLVWDTGRWGNLSPEQRRDLGRLGVRRRGGRGLCSACYFRAQRDGTIDAFQCGRGETGACTRCSIESGLTDGLCGDCRLVCSDLHELERWAS